MQHHKYSLTELENMAPWEREIYAFTSQPYKRRKRKARERSKNAEDKIVVPADKPEISKKVRLI